MDRPIRVLHVDDEPGFAEVAAEFLRRANDRIEIRTEPSAEDGIDALRDDRIDCVVSDHDMPGADGIEFLEAVRADHPDLPFVLFTGKGSEEIASKAVSAGVTDYLQKEHGTDQYTILANRIENAVERYRSQRAVRRQRRRLETLVDNLPGVVYRCRNEPGWPMEYVDGECERLTGYAADAIETGDVTWGEDVVHPDDKPEVWSTVQDAIENGEPFECTYRIECAAGRTKWVWERGRAVTTSTGSVEALEGFITDVTDSKERERELSRYRRRFEAIFDDPNLLVGLLDPDGTIRDVNETAIGYTDVERADVVGEPFRDGPWWTDDQRADVDEWIADAAAGAYVEYEAVHPTDDGGRLTVEGSFRPVTDDRGTVTTIVVSAKDVSERVRHERELERHEERLDRFADFASHDLQSPMSAVKGRLQLALETGDMEHVERAAEAMDRVDELRNDLVDTLRTGEIVAEAEPVDLGVVMDDVWTAIDPPETASFDLVDSVTTEGDPDALQRLFENLVGNSLEHGDAGTTIRIGAFDGGIYYEDDGPGIDPGDREAAFVPGFSTKEHGEETGLGMASVEQVVSAHGWTIEVDDAETLDGVRLEIRTD